MEESQKVRKSYLRGGSYHIFFGLLFLTLASWNDVERTIFYGGALAFIIGGMILIKTGPYRSLNFKERKAVFSKYKFPNWIGYVFYAAYCALFIALLMHPNLTTIQAVLGWLACLLIILGIASIMYAIKMDRQPHV